MQFFSSVPSESMATTAKTIRPSSLSSKTFSFESYPQSQQNISQCKEHRLHKISSYCQLAQQKKNTDPTHANLTSELSAHSGK